VSVPTRAAFAALGVAAVSCALVGAASPAFAAPGNDFRVYLGNRGGDAAQQLAAAVSTPGNAKYGQFLTAAQYRAAFSRPSRTSTPSRPG